MAGWLEVATIAFVAQLSVLPGEKGQFIVAGLSTRYDPLLVVAAAGSAFAGWTVLEIALGNALRGALPQVLVDAGAGLLFLAFAVLLLRAAPPSDGDAAATDGGLVDEMDPTETKVGTGDRTQVPADDPAGAGGLEVRLPWLDWRVPTTLGNFLPIFALMAMGEFGDKTQLVTIGLAAQYAHGTAIWAGEMAAILPVTLLNAFFFARFSHRFDLRRAHLLGAALFAFFGVDTLQATVTGVSAWETIVAEAAKLVGVALQAATAA